MQKIQKQSTETLKRCYLAAFFSEEPYLVNFIDRAAEYGILRFRDLENYSRVELFSKVKTTKENQERFVKGLSNLGIKLH